MKQKKKQKNRESEMRVGLTETIQKGIKTKTFSFLH